MRKFSVDNAIFPLRLAENSAVGEASNWCRITLKPRRLHFVRWPHGLGNGPHTLGNWLMGLGNGHHGYFDCLTIFRRTPSGGIVTMVAFQPGFLPTMNPQIRVTKTTFSTRLCQSFHLQWRIFPFTSMTQFFLQNTSMRMGISSVVKLNFRY